MKKIIPFLILFSFVLFACVTEPAAAPQGALAQGLVSLPDDASVLILSLVTAGLAWLLVKVNMGAYTQALAAVIAPMIVTAIETFLGTIPPVFDNLVLSLLHLLVLFVSGSVGAFLLFKRAKTPAQLLA